MKTAFKRLPVLVLLLNTVQAAGGELLGKMSDETAPLAAQPEPAVENNDRRIIYRVICSPEGEALPECSQPPVNDTFEAAQPRPEAVEAPAADTPKEQVEQAELGDRTSNAVEAVTAKKAATHKKPTKKSVKKSAKKSAKAEKKRKHR